MDDPKNHLPFTDYIMKVAHRKPLVAVIGGGSCNDEIYALAEEVGREIAIRQGIVVCGGLYGVMEACCKGAKSAGGVTIGILPGIGIDESNDYVDIPIATGLGMARNAIIARTGRVAVAVDGKYGTLSEIGFFLQLEKPVVGLRTWDIPNVIMVDKPGAAVSEAFKFLV